MGFRISSLNPDYAFVFVARAQNAGKSLSLETEE
jgi:hypothetical protein